MNVIFSQPANFQFFKTYQYSVVNICVILLKYWW